MDYVKLYTRVLTLPKWLSLSPRAKVLLVQAWMFSGNAESDGHVPDSARPVIGYSAAPARELEAAGWWHLNGSGWHLNDWTEHQTTRDRMVERRAADRERKRRERLRQEAPL